MKVIILAAGQGTRLRPLTDDKPKCMVEVGGISIIERQLTTMRLCGINEKDIYIVCGYKHEILREHLADSDINFIVNEEFEITNMVCSLMCARDVMDGEIIVSYGDIIYSQVILKKLMDSRDAISVVVDDGWHAYWSARCEDPTSDAETLKFGVDGSIIEIGQKSTDLKDIESQYIGLMKYSTEGTKQVVKICRLAQKRSEKGIKLWRTTRNYSKMYMTDMLQGLVDEGIKIWPVHIQRGWFEIDNLKDLSVAEKDLPSLNENEQGIFAIQEGIVIEEINNQRHNPGPKRSEKN